MHWHCEAALSSPCLGAHRPWTRPLMRPAGTTTSAEGLGCVVLAGGQGTRLGWPAPKGTFPLRGKSLFEHLLGNVREKGAFIAIMTSPCNHDETVLFFRAHDQFGCTNLHFFVQGMLPLLDGCGHRVRESSGRFVEGPDGNGSFFVHFVQSGLAALCREQGVERLQVIAVDNILGRPFDRAWHQAHQQAGVEVTLSAVMRRRGEAMGLLVEKEGRLRIAEYSEIDPSLLEKEEENGALLYAYGNGGRWMMNCDFIERMAHETLPLHWAEKGGLWKGERFIFDALVHGTSLPFLFAREESYAPLKRKEQVEEIEAFL